MQKIRNAIFWLGHPALGAMTFAIGDIHPVFAFCWCWLWITYEKQEYHEIKDTCAVDLRGFMVGFGVTAIILFLRKVTH